MSGTSGRMLDISARFRIEGVEGKNEIRCGQVLKCGETLYKGLVGALCRDCSTTAGSAE